MTCRSLCLLKLKGGTPLQVIGLDGKQYSWYLVDYIPSNDYIEYKSSIHLNARALLRELFTAQPILEEVLLPGTKGLSADFYIPMAKLLIEVQGEQHYKFVRFFNNDYLSFIRAKLRDEQKRSWCELNNITIIEFKYNETIDEWRSKITGC